MICYDSCSSPFGQIQIGYEDGTIISVKRWDEEFPCTPSPVTDAASAQLLEYFARSREAFDLPTNARGTPFQMAVWQALQHIPYGETRTYGQIAAAIGKPRASRAVGMACNRNPLWILIPCHRVVGANHDLTGYAGGLAMKQALLDMEKTAKTTPKL